MREDAWLSTRFGWPAFTVEGEAPAVVADHAAQHSRALYQVKVEADRVAAVAGLIEIGFKVVDVNLTHSRTPARLEGKDPPETVIGDAREEHRDSLIELVDRDFRASRFYLDPDVPDELAARIMRDWLNAYFDGTRGERLIVASDGDRVAGFVAILNAPEGPAPTKTIDVIAVRREARGVGLGRALVRHALASALGLCERVDVGTQVSNLTALGLYARMGFVVRQARYVLHMHSEGS